MDLDALSIDAAAMCEYDGTIMVHGFRISHVTGLRTIKPCLGSLRLAYRFNFHGAVTSGVHEQPAVVTRAQHTG